jgi:hypothetical protein
MERRHIVIPGQPRIGRVTRVATGIQQDHPPPGLGKPGRERTAAGAGADHDMIAVGIFDG